MPLQCIGLLHHFHNGRPSPEGMTHSGVIEATAWEGVRRDARHLHPSLCKHGPAACGQTQRTGHHFFTFSHRHPCPRAQLAGCFHLQEAPRWTDGSLDLQQILQMLKGYIQKWGHKGTDPIEMMPPPHLPLNNLSQKQH